VGVYLYVFVFLFIGVFVNYYFDFENKYMYRHFGNFVCIFKYFLLYSVSYFGVLIPVLLIRKRAFILKNKILWFKAILVLILISIGSGSRFFSHFVSSFNDYNTEYFLRKIVFNTQSLLFILLPFIIVKVFLDRDEKGLYGLRKKGFYPLPFLLMLSFVLPMIVWASFQKDFLQSYPSFRSWQVNPVFGLSKFQETGIFEIAYGSDFVMTELIYRGFLVIGLSAILGKDAVIAMCGLYVFIHFGKPLAETVSSFFGGYILGVIAFYFRNILGGCVIHLGLAWMMEAAAFIQIVGFERYS
jgi:hypothetical protein